MPNVPGVRKRIDFTTKDDTVEPAILANPTEITVSFGKVGATPTVVVWSGVNNQIVKTATGTFHIDIDCPESGQWAARIETDGLVGATERAWFIDESYFP